MFVLHIEMKLKPGSRESLERAYIEIFRPAISRQAGFGGVSLLRPVDDEGDYRLSIAFNTQTSQQEWLATDLHEKAWRQIEAQCAEYSVTYFNAV
jgi:heme-degrading monooxygenase HmoA